LFEFLILPIFAVIILLLLAVPIIFIYLFLRLSETAFEMVGFSHWNASLAVFGSVLGSLIDIPIGIVPLSAYPDWYLFLYGIFGQQFPLVFHPVYLAINMGGCIIPLAVSFHLLLNGRAAPGKALLGILIVAVITYIAAEAVPGEGIVLPFWLSPLLAAICGLALAGGFRGAPPLAYISGTIGTLIGADILSLLTPGVIPALSPLHLHQTEPLVLSIGGAGVFDGIFLTGVMAVLLSAVIVYMLKGSWDGENSESNP
jgi:uncharacterized membrane protein